MLQFYGIISLNLKPENEKQTIKTNDTNNVAKRWFQNWRTRNEAYQSIAFRKRQPLIEERLHKTHVRFESNRRHLWQLQQFHLQRRRIANDLHLHLNQNRIRIRIRIRISHSQTKLNRDHKTINESWINFSHLSSLNFNAFESEPCT